MGAGISREARQGHAQLCPAQVLGGSPVSLALVTQLWGVLWITVSTTAWVAADDHANPEDSTGYSLNTIGSSRPQEQRDKGTVTVEDTLPTTSTDSQGPLLFCLAILRATLTYFLL